MLVQLETAYAGFSPKQDFEALVGAQGTCSSSAEVQTLRNGVFVQLPALVSFTQYITQMKLIET